MKDVLCVSFLILFLISIIVCNCIYMNHNADYISSRVDEIFLDEESENKIYQIEDFWQRNKMFIALSISFQDMDKIDDLISNLRSAYDTSNAYELEKAKAMLRNASGLFTRYERLHLENIL